MIEKGKGEEERVKLRVEWNWWYRTKQEYR